jgi:hypothetical protein
MCSLQEPRIQLSLRGPNLANVENSTIILDNDDESVFNYVQRLVQSADWGQVRGLKIALIDIRDL